MQIRTGIPMNDDVIFGALFLSRTLSDWCEQEFLPKVWRRFSASRRGLTTEWGKLYERQAMK
jgi:hypothetical protein